MGRSFTPLFQGGFDSWPIVRSKPVGPTRGRSVSLFINNGLCHLVTVDVYADGAIDCWGFVDLALFRQKLETGWVIPAPRPGQILSVFNFGSTGIADGQWLHTSSEIEAEVRRLLHTLNPDGLDLLDMQGSSTEVRNNVRTAKLGLSDKRPVRLPENSRTEIPGQLFPVLYRHETAFELTRLVIYADGVCQIGTDPILLPRARLVQLFAEGTLSNHAPQGSRIRLPGLGAFTTTMDFGDIAVADRLMEIEDALNMLNGQEGAIRHCLRCFETYRGARTEENRATLRQAYEAVPEHLRCYCGDMDTRDTEIQEILYGQSDEND